MNSFPDFSLPPSVAALIECPPWCTRGAGHAPDCVERTGSVFVWHYGDVSMAGGREIQLQQCARLDEDGSATLQPVELVIDGDPLAAMDLSAARAFVAGLALATIAGGAQ